ncbi:MAG: hypothetical protein HC765_12450 [Brachymonas sp.]|nr:hypothetical protein [Brachymonas sp.]
MAWLHQEAVAPAWGLMARKLQDHHCELERYASLLKKRYHMLHSEPELATDFRQEMRRFLPVQIVEQTADRPEFWQFLSQLMQDLLAQTLRTLEDKSSVTFRM